MSQRETFRETLIVLIENAIGQRIDDLKDSQTLREDLKLDSLDVASLVSQIERHFRIHLNQQQLEKLATVDDLLNLLESMLGAAPAAA